MIARRAVLGALAAPFVLTHTARASSRVRVGLALPLTGLQATVAAELLAGYQLAFAGAKKQGIEIALEVEDDQSSADRTAAAIRRFGLDSTFVAASGIVGTPHARAGIPVARQAGLPLVGLRSGADELRDGGPWVYHLRASYQAELTRMLAMLQATADSIALVASDDAFGRPAAAFVEAEARRRGLRVVATRMADRDGKNVDEAVQAVTKPDLRANALMVLMITRPAIQAVRAARSVGFWSPVFLMSFTAGSELIAAGPSVYRGLGLVSAFPVPRASHDETSESFRRAAATAGLKTLVESITAAEGYWYGTTLARAIERAGTNVSRESVVRALEAAPPVRLGGEPLAFDRARVGRKSLDVVYVDRTGTLRS